MSSNKTVLKDTNVEEFINSVENERRRNDAVVLLEFMNRVTGMKPRMWGDTLIGYGQYHYKYDSGREGDSFLTGFSPRKANMTIYIMPGFKSYQSQLAKLGKHKSSVSCLYVNKLSDIDMDVLEEIVIDSVKHMRGKYPDSKSE